MTDSEFTRKLRQAARAYNKARALIRLCEAEYIRRYGNHPSDINDDAWIDSVGGPGLANDTITAKQVEDGALLSKSVCSPENMN